MSDLSLALRISAREDASLALNSISKSLRNIEKQTEELNKNRNKSNQYWNNKDKREQEKHETWKTNLLTRETEKRIRLEQRAVREQLRLKENAKRQMMKTEEDFRSSAARMALYVTAPTALLATFGMRAYMEMEQRQIKMKMLYGNEAKDMEQFALDYALKTAFTIENTSRLIEGLSLGKEKLGVKTNAEIKDLTKSVGDVLLAYAPSAEAQSGVMYQLKQILTSTKGASAMDLRIMSEWGLNIERLATIVGVQKKGEQWSAAEIVKVLQLASKTNEVQTAMIENAKSFTQAWGTSKESMTMVFEGLGKTLDKQFDLTNNTKIFAGLLQKIGMSLKEDKDNLTKGMGSYLTMMALTVAPMLMLIGHWRKVLLLIGESNMKSGVFKDRLLMVGGAMSGLYLATVNWGDLMKQYEEQGFLKTTLGNLDKVIALMMVGGALWKAIQALYAFWIAKEARLTALAVIRAAATNPFNLIAVGGAAAAIGGTYLLAQGFGGKSGEEINKDMGYDPLARMLGNENQSYASGRDVAMLEYMSKSQPNIEVVNNINVDKSGNVTVETKQNNKDVYRSPYTAPIISDFSLGY